MSNLIVWFDFFSALLLFVTALLGAYLPRYFVSWGGNAQRRERMSRYFHLGNMLSAGVMISAAFCHLLAEAQATLLFVGGFPITNFLAALGFIITLVADHFAQMASSAVEDGPAVAAGRPLPRLATLDADSESGYLTMEDRDSSATGKHSGKAVSQTQHRYLELPLSSPVAGGERLSLSSADHSHFHNHQHGHRHAYNESLSSHGEVGRGEFDGPSGGALQEQAPLVPRAGSEASPFDDKDGDPCEAGIRVFLGNQSIPFHTAVLLACALSIHSVLEGMALGAQQTLRNTEDVMIAIVAHKGLAAYALGASVVESRSSTRRFWTVIGTFALASPIGILLGLVLSRNADGNGGAVMSALAAGTFLYVAVMEVLPKELGKGAHHRADGPAADAVPKLAVFLLGFGLMSLLAIWA